MLLITILFLIPGYYLAKSKGYNAAKVLTIAGIFSLWYPAVSRCIEGLDPFPIIDISFPLIALLVIWLLPAKKGAPGKAYLNISFVCPECNQEVKFERRFEGQAVLCKKCDEIITVPTDEFSPKAEKKKRIKPAVLSGKVCFDEFVDEICAEQLTDLFNAHGIKAEMIGNIAAGALPQLSVLQGFKVMIDIADWDMAVEIEEKVHSEKEQILEDIAIGEHDIAEGNILSHEEAEKRMERWLKPDE